MEHERQLNSHVPHTVVVYLPAVYGYWYSYTYVFGHPYFIMFILQEVKLNNLIKTISTTLRIYIATHGLNIEYVPCNYILSNDET